MSISEITCELVDENDLDTRYLGGRLSPEEAEAFEAHYFGCERCWGLVQQGLAVQSVFRPDPSLAGSSSSPPVPSARAHRRWWGLAAAAGIVAVALGVWQRGDVAGPVSPEDVLRGGETPFVVTTSANNKVLQAAWPRLPKVDVYRVRLYAADGTLLEERELTDTSIVLIMDSIPLPRSASAFWEVQGFDHLRQPVTRSDLTRATSDLQP